MSTLEYRVKSAGAQLAMSLPRPLQRLLALRPIRRDGLTLAPEVQLLLTLQRLVREPPVETLPVPEAREAMVRQARMVSGRQRIGALRDLTVDGAAGPIPARLYIPSSRLGADPAPTMLFIHGGGWVYGDLESHDAACRHLAEHARIQVLAIDYRRAPEHPFPAAAEDAVAAYRWLVTHTDEVNADPSRLAVGGDSAGGNLSAVVALTAAREGQPLHHQMLVYPATDFAGRTESRRLFGEGFYLSERFMDQCEEMYAAAHDRAAPLLSPLRTSDVPAGVAPALIVTAGFDPLRDEGEAYAALLRSHGVPVELIRYGSLIHGFFNMVGAGHVAPAAAREIAEKVGAALG